jgi:hypothetical protein
VPAKISGAAFGGIVEISKREEPMLALGGRARRGVHVVMTFAALATAAVAGTAAPVAAVIHGRSAYGLLYFTAVRDGI